MRSIAFVFVLLLFSACSSSNPDSFEGVYFADEMDENQVWIFVDGYASRTIYDDDAYIGTQGGTYELHGEVLMVDFEFDDRNSSKVGEKETYTLEFDRNGFTDKEGTRWIKQLKNTQDLDGLWKITEREEEGELKEIHQSGSRKTIKLLKDGYFQWIAIEPDEKKFFGSGGGTYTFEDGTYTE